ncbi:unnamed protein product [Spirodela intermedia]|uniref:Uncharacterized protein n=1 Tax=Spirodela intermedia TaxID=51605 RepID=A0A7I8IXG5_SPIIN|nr:unnamed protein product [Spirodela intermedia]CAA6662275.1 unnamed protein product [Spirodela intermedia]
MAREEGLTLRSIEMVWKSWKLMWRSHKQLLLILLIFFLPFSILLGAFSFYIFRLVVVMIGMFMPMIAGKLVITEVANLLASILLSALLDMAVIYTVAMALKQKEMTLKDLIFKIWKTWRARWSPSSTSFYCQWLSQLFLLLIYAVVFGGGFTMGSIALASAIFLLLFLLTVYLEMVWFQGIVVSASDLIQGERGLGFMANLLMNLLALIVNLLFFVLGYMIWYEKAILLVLLFVISGINLLIATLKVVIYVMFYNKCRDNPEKELAMKDRLVYNRVSSSIPIPEDLP